jgi:fructose-1,6-bisphosphatase/inositol monophosphatase family enzyme
MGISGITFEYVKTAQAVLIEKLSSQLAFERELGQVVRRKSSEHTAHKVDDFSDEILFSVLRQYPNIGWKIFTEEKGWITDTKRIDYKVICDPFCNTTLALRSFRESAVAICLADKDNSFISCAIADLNTQRIFYADREQVSTFMIENGEWISLPTKVSKATSLSDAFISISSLKKRRREAMAGKEIFTRAGQLHCLDGAIYIGRAAAGYLDAYLDPYIGQPLYEVPCLEMMKRAGGVVTDMLGNEFNFSRLISDLEKEPHARYKFIAAATEELHNEIYKAL